MASIEKLDERNLYENPRPAVRSRQAAFPGVVKLPSGELLALFVIGEAFEAANSRTYVSRSSDQGKSWQLEGQLYDQEALNLGYQFSDCYKPTVLKDGTLIAVGYGFERHDPEKGIGDAETGGFPPGRNVAVFSRDHGRTWTLPGEIKHGLEAMLELSGPCIQLACGDLLAVAPPFTTSKSGQRGVVLRSSDGGHRWSIDGEFFKSPHGNIAPWECRVCEMQAGRLVCIFWAFDTAAGKHLPNHVVVSHDAGKTWSQAINTGHMGQASNLMWLGGEKLLTIHAHRAGKVGLYVRLIDFTGDRWKVEHETVIWGKATAQDTSKGIIDQFANLKFGQPSLLALDDNEVLAIHWCVEDCLYKIKTHRLRVAV